MSKLLTALLAAGFGIGLNAASAQDVRSHQSKLDCPQQMTQEKKQGAINAIPSDAQSDRSSVNSAAQVGSKQQIPSQSMPSVGHPKQGAISGQFGVKKLDETGQLDQSMSAISDQGGDNGPDRRITPN